MPFYANFCLLGAIYARPNVCLLGATYARPNASATVQPQEHRVVDKPHPGLITAEPYSWKSLVSGQPVLRLRTTGVKCAALQLPPG